MLSNIAKAIKLKIEERLGIVPLEIKELSQTRLEICKVCPSMYFSPVLDTEVCGQCGCYLKLKTLVENEKCKIDKW